MKGGGLLTGRILAVTTGREHEVCAPIGGKTLVSQFSISDIHSGNRKRKLAEVFHFPFRKSENGQRKSAKVFNFLIFRLEKGETDIKKTEKGKNSSIF